jgi:glycolate oxidase FAD binding subunit
MKLASLNVTSSALDLSDLSAQGLVADRGAGGGGSGRDAEEAPSPAFRPSSVAEVADVIAAAAADDAPLLLSGGRTRLHWANPLHSVGAGLALDGLAGVIEFEPDEGVLKAGAGTAISEVQRGAESEGWEFPLDPPSPGTSTVGGTISSAATGPRAHAFGSVADAILGLEVVGADGVPSKCGGRVVKNVTGYDMAKLYCGAFGTLGAVTSAWLRLRPRPTQLRSLETVLPATPENFKLCRTLAKQKSVRAFVWEETGPADGMAQVVVEWGGSPEGVAHDHAEAEAAFARVAFGAGEAGAAGGPASTQREGDSSAVDQIRDERARQAGADEVVLRARVLGTDAFEMLRALREAGLAVSVDVGLGALHARGVLSESSALLALRRAAESGSGLLFAEAMPPSWRGSVDAFGSSGAAAPLMATLKKRFDPAGLLNPGRFIEGGGMSR